VQLSKRGISLIGSITIASVIIIISGVTRIAFVPIPNIAFIDTMVVPVIIGSMIGIANGKTLIPSIILGLIWSLTTYIAFPGIPLSLIAWQRIPTAMMSAVAYSTLMKKRPGRASNVFIAAMIAVVFHSVLDILLGFLIIGNTSSYYAIHDTAFTMYHVHNIIAYKLIPETLFTVFCLNITINKLRIIGLLNGIKHSKGQKDYIEMTYSMVNGIKLVLHYILGKII